MANEEPCSFKEVAEWHLSLALPATFKYYKHEFVVHPEVFCPFIAPSGKLGLVFTSIPRFFRNKRILEVGCGSGIISLLMAFNGADYVLGVDKSAKAISNAKDNQKRHGTKNVEFRHSDLFDSISEKELSNFDIFFADLPMVNSKGDDNLFISADSPLFYAFYDEELKATLGYIEKILSILKRKPEKEAFLCFSTLDHSIKEMVENNFHGQFIEFFSVNLEWIHLKMIKFKFAR